LLLPSTEPPPQSARTREGDTIFGILTALHDRR